MLRLEKNDDLKRKGRCLVVAVSENLPEVTVESLCPG
jgi:hypothetical protein